MKISVMINGQWYILSSNDTINNKSIDTLKPKDIENTMFIEVHIKENIYYINPCFIQFSKLNEKSNKVTVMKKPF